MNQLAALTQGLAVTQAARGAQAKLRMAGQRLPFLETSTEPAVPFAVPIACVSRVESYLFDPPNAINGRHLLRPRTVRISQPVRAAVAS